MSWLYGYLHKLPARMEVRMLHAKPADAEFSKPNLDVFAGGRDALFTWLSLEDKGFLAILGRPVILDGANYRYPTQQDWLTMLADPQRLSRMEGHYCIVHYSGTKLSFYNDPLGKRSIYFRETAAGWFFCTDLTLLKKHSPTQIDLSRFGALWHAIFPPTQGGYAPQMGSLYSGIEMLGSGAEASIDPATYRLEINNRLFSPQPVNGNAAKMLESYCLLPYKSGMRMGMGLSGGMDIRPLLAIYLANDVPLTVYNYGTKDNYDYRVAYDIAKRFGLPFRFIPYSEAQGDWQQVTSFMADRGPIFNPLHSANLGYYPLVAEETDAYVSGYFGEVFRFRMMAAVIKSVLSLGKLDYHDIAAYLFRNPPNFFVPEAAGVMHRGFWDALKAAVNQMPSSYDMPNPMWMHLFVIRYWFKTLQSANYPWVDSQVLNILPWVQPAMFSQHWQLGFIKQLNEGLHRGIIKTKYPLLEQFPLSATDLAAPYRTRQFILKLRTWAFYKTHKRLRETRTTDFLNMHKPHIIELLYSAQIKDDSALDKPKLTAMVEGFYKGDASYQDALVCFLAYALGK